MIDEYEQLRSEYRKVCLETMREQWWDDYQGASSRDAEMRRELRQFSIANGHDLVELEQFFGEVSLEQQSFFPK